MGFRPTTLERAYQLAASGDCQGVSDIKRALKAEGFLAIDDQLYGMSTSKALKQLCSENYRELNAGGEPRGGPEETPPNAAARG